MSSSNCCFLTCIEVSQEAGQVVWYSHLFQNFPQFIVIHTKALEFKNSSFAVVFKSSYLFFLVISLVLWLTEQIPDISPWRNANPVCYALLPVCFFNTVMFTVISSSPGVTCECQSSSQACTYWVASLSPYVAFLMVFPCFFCVHYLRFLLYFSQVLKCVPQGCTAGSLISWLSGVLICCIFTSFRECYLLMRIVL